MLAKLLDGKVAVITGSGRGIGKAIAMELSKHGARLVVNDPGVTANGCGEDHSVADEAVREILSKNGTAIANYDRVDTMLGGERIIRAAVENFGRVDILVNNAGIVRHGMFVNMTEDDWNSVVTVNLNGCFNCTRPAINYMISQSFGRVINMSSGAALGKWAGGVNYSAAKAGILGFTRSLAFEVKQHGITVNAVMPSALTRLTEATLSLESVKESLQMSNALRGSPPPENVAPLIAYLASDGASAITARTFGARSIGAYQLLNDPTEVSSIWNNGIWTVEDLARAVPQGLMK